MMRYGFALAVVLVLVSAAPIHAQQKQAFPLNVPGARMEAEFDKPSDGAISGMTPQPWTAFHGWAFDCISGQQPTTVTATHKQNGVNTSIEVFVVGGQFRPDVQAAFSGQCPALTNPHVGVSVYFPQGVPMSVGYGVVEVVFHYAERRVKLTRMLKFIGR